MAQQQQDVTPVQLIDYLGALLTHDLSDEIGQMYFGDVGQYPPSAFKDGNGKDVAVIAIAMASDKADRAHQSPAYRETLWMIDITVMISMIPYFEALPKEAFGERKLLILIEKIKSILRQNEAQQLYSRVKGTEIMDVDFQYGARGVTGGPKNQTNFTREATIKLAVIVHESRR